MPKVTYNNIVFDSTTELDFYFWLVEAKDAGYLKSFKYHSITFDLLDKAIYNSKTLLQPHVYTPDFFVIINDKFRTLDHKIKLLLDNNLLYIEIKGDYSKFNDHAKFSVSRKILYDKHKVYVPKIVPDKWFKRTWVPKAIYRTKVKKDIVKKYQECILLEEFIEK